MIHVHISNDNGGDHYAVGTSNKNVLVQLQKDGEQVRLSLTPKQAQEMAMKLMVKSVEAESKKESL